MKQWIFNGALIIGVALMTACGSTEKDTKQAAAAGYSKLSNEESMDAEMKAIDESVAKSGLVANSLNYSKESGAAILVLAHLSSDNEILKLEEKYADGNGGNSGTVFYYMKDKMPLATVERFEDNSNPQAPKFVERISYYDAKGKVLGTKEKRVNFEEELAGVSYISVPAHACSTERALQVLEQKGDFETTFQGFAETEVLNYLVVGQADDDGYTSALRVEYEDEFIKDALAHQLKYLNRKCRITFHVAEASSGFEYQVYTGGKWE